MLLFCLLDPVIQFKDLFIEDEIIHLNANLFNQIFLQKYREYSLDWLDQTENRPEDTVYSLNYVYTDDIMFLPKKYHAIYQEQREDITRG